MEVGGAAPGGAVRALGIGGGDVTREGGRLHSGAAEVVGGGGLPDRRGQEEVEQVEWEGRSEEERGGEGSDRLGVYGLEGGRGIPGI